MATENQIVRALSPKHVSRYNKHKNLNMSLEEIAAEEKTRLSTIRQSINSVEMYLAMNNLENLQASEIETILSTRQLQREAIARALIAKKEIIQERTGEVLAVGEDHATQLDAYGKVTDRIEALQPRKGMQVNVAAMASSGGVGAASMSYERLLREINQRRREEKERKPLELPDSNEGEGTVIDAEHSEA